MDSDNGGGAGEQGDDKQQDAKQDEGKQQDEVKQQDDQQQQQEQQQDDVKQQEQEQQDDVKQQEQQQDDVKQQEQQQQPHDNQQQEQQQDYKQQEQQQQQDDKQQEQEQQQEDQQQEQQEDDNSADGATGDDDVKSSGDGSTVNDSTQRLPVPKGAEANQTADGSRVDKPTAEELLVNMSATDRAHAIKKDGREDSEEREILGIGEQQQQKPGPKPSAETQSAQQESAKSQEKPTPQRPAKQTERGEESPHPAYTPDTQPTQQTPVGLIIVTVLVGVLAMVMFQYLRHSPEPARPTLNRTEVLQQELLKVKQSFRNQRGELWRRSSIHLQRHVKSAKPNEPVSLILAGGLRAEKTLGCLAARLAEAFSTAYNGSVQQLYGTQLANVEHDQAKLVLDTKLKEGFEGDKPAAVIHRLEELPPSSSLIFYRYCDHENAAYKHPLLAFTVLLPLDTVGPDVSLPQVEELVHSHIHRKFLTPDQPDTFDKMDVDKLSGLWSRISHLILPVDVEEHIEKRGCERN